VVNLWAVYPVTAPCGDRDEAVKVTKQRRRHVRMKLTELYRSQNQAVAKIHTSY
jgi:hypothetical protein